MINLMAVIILIITVANVRLWLCKREGMQGRPCLAPPGKASLTLVFYHQANANLNTIISTMKHSKLYSNYFISVLYPNEDRQGKFSITTHQCQHHNYHHRSKTFKASKIHIAKD